MTSLEDKLRLLLSAVEVAQSLLGQTNRRMTQRYAGQDVDTAKKAVRALG